MMRSVCNAHTVHIHVVGDVLVFVCLFVILLLLKRTKFDEELVPVQSDHMNSVHVVGDVSLYNTKYSICLCMTRSLYLFMWSEMCPEEPGWNARSLRSDSIDGIESRDSKSTFLEATCC